MSDERDERLAAKVKATNRANAAAMELYATLAAIFIPLVGQKVIKVDGTLLAKVKASLPALPHTHALSICQNLSSHSSLVWNVKAGETANGIGMSCDVGVYVGHLSGTTLIGLYEAQQRRSDYTAEEIVQKREAYKAARDAADAARSALGQFGEYDR